MFKSLCITLSVITIFLDITGEVKGDDTQCCGDECGGSGGQDVFKDHGDVVILTDENFNEKILKKLALVMFCAPWCGPCQAMWPAFKAAASQLKNNDPKVVLMKVDCEKYPKLCDEHKIESYPSLHIYKNGKFCHAYEGADRSENGIIQYMKELAANSKGDDGSCKKGGSDGEDDKNKDKDKYKEKGKEEEDKDKEKCKNKDKDEGHCNKDGSCDGDKCCDDQKKNCEGKENCGSEDVAGCVGY